jgi:hypothetical protein
MDCTLCHNPITESVFEAECQDHHKFHPECAQQVVTYLCPGIDDQDIPCQGPMIDLGHELEKCSICQLLIDPQDNMRGVFISLCNGRHQFHADCAQMIDNNTCPNCRQQPFSYDFNNSSDPQSRVLNGVWVVPHGQLPSAGWSNAVIQNARADIWAPEATFAGVFSLRGGGGVGATVDIAYDIYDSDGRMVQEQAWATSAMDFQVGLAGYRLP